MGVMSSDDIGKYSMGKAGVKGCESPSYYLDHESGKYFTLVEGEGVPMEYDRGRSTGVRRRDRTPTHGKVPRSPWACPPLLSHQPLPGFRRSSMTGDPRNRHPAASHPRPRASAPPSPFNPLRSVSLRAPIEPSPVGTYADPLPSADNGHFNAPPTAPKNEERFL